jgi:hypothetical protein
LKIAELEEYLIGNMGELISSCIGVCRESEIPQTMRLIEGLVYSGCDYCILKTAIDKITLPTIELSYRDGRIAEFILLEEAIIELGEESAQVIDRTYFDERLSELKEFGLITEEDANFLKNWVRNSRVNSNKE